MNLTGKTVLVTGAAGTGVGSGMCQAIADAGGRLVLNTLTQEEARRAAARYGNVPIYTADVASNEQVEKMFALIEAEVGPLDGVVNNAGIGLSREAHEAHLQEFERLQAVDLKGVWLVSKAFVGQAKRYGIAGSIVHLSSVHAVATIRGYAIYASAKAGVEGLTRGMAVELGHLGIRCNAIAPGYIHSEQNLGLISTWAADPEDWVRSHIVNQQVIEREIHPIDCGWAAVFFLSEMSRCITGQVLRVDAGTTSLLYNKDFV